MPKWLLLSRSDQMDGFIVAVIAKISSEIAVCLTLSTLRNVAAEMSMRLAISSDVGSRPSSWTTCREVRSTFGYRTPIWGSAGRED